MITDSWYAVATPRQVRRQPLALRRFGRDLVLWRDATGRVVVMPDRCPHKGARLSDGRVQDGTLACPYHGFRFDPAGACVATPVQPTTRIPHAMCVHPLPSREVHGLVWVWVGDGTPTEEVPWFDDVPTDSVGAWDGALVYPVHYSRMIESNFDVYHFPFVHRSIDPGMGEAVEDIAVHAEDDFIHSEGVIVNRSGRRTPYHVDFKAPNLQVLGLTRHVLGFIACTPIDDDHTWVYARVHTDYTRWAWVNRLLSFLILSLDWHVAQARQDIPVLRHLTPRQTEPGACVWVHADAGAARYVQWRARALQAQAQREETPRAPTPLRQAGA